MNVPNFVDEFSVERLVDLHNCWQVVQLLTRGQIDGAGKTAAAKQARTHEGQCAHAFGHLTVLVSRSCVPNLGIKRLSIHHNFWVSTKLEDEAVAELFSTVQCPLELRCFLFRQP